MRVVVVVVEDAADDEEEDEEDVGLRRHGDLVRDVAVQVHVPRLVALKCYGAYLMLRLL